MPPRTRRTTARRATATRRSSPGRRLTAAQRNKLPASAFIDRTHRRFPVPTAAQARAAGISEAQRAGILRSALSRAGQTQPSRQRRGRGGRMVTVKTVTPATARRYVRKRGSGKVASVTARTRRTTTARRTPRRRATSGRRRR